ncbi:MAG: hypothetical protein AB7P04_03140 [Bacteriovoracia bacterium]
MKKFLSLVALIVGFSAFPALAGHFYCERSPGECVLLCRHVLHTPWARYTLEDDRCEMEAWLPVGCECLEEDEL